MGYFSNLAIAEPSLRFYQEGKGHSYFGPCEQLRLRLKELLDRFEELDLSKSKRPAPKRRIKPELFNNDLEYVLPEDMDHIFDIILAIGVTRCKLRSRYEISAELGSDAMLTRIVTYERSPLWKRNIDAVKDLLCAA